MDPESRLRRWFAAIVTLAGLLIMAFGVTGSYRHWWSDDVWTSVFVEVGSGIALVSVIVFIERALTEEVEQRVTESQQSLSQRIDDLAKNLADLNARAIEVPEEQHRTEDQKIQQRDVSRYPEN